MVNEGQISNIQSGVNNEEGFNMYSSNYSPVYVNGIIYIDNTNDLLTWGSYCQIRMGGKYYFINNGQAGSLAIDPNKVIAAGKNRGYSFHLFFNTDTTNLEISEEEKFNTSYVELGTIYDGGYGEYTYFNGTLMIDGQNYILRNDRYTTSMQHYFEAEGVRNYKYPYTSDFIYFTVQVNQNFEDNVNSSSNVQDNEQMADVYCVLKLPATYTKNGKKVPIVMFCHGAGGMVKPNWPGELYNANKLVEAGYAVFDVNGSNNNYTVHSEHMGGPRVIEAYKKAFKYIKEHYNVEDRMMVHGHSMGGLTALNFIASNPDMVKAAGIYYPVTDLYNQAWLSPWFGQETRISIAREYNFDDKTGNTYEADKVIGFNPIKNNSVVAGDTQYNFFPVPMKIWHGTSDIVVSLNGTKQYVQNIRNAGGRVHLRIVNGMGHDHNDMLHNEEVMWFNRWND